VDSVAAHFRQGFGDMSLRSRLLSGLGQTMMKFANGAVNLKGKLAVNIKKNLLFFV